MNILITGGSGFLGARLARALLARGAMRLLLTDRAEPPSDLRSDARVAFVGGDLLEMALRRDLPGPVDAVYHLSAAVSGECEADFDLGMRSNLDTTRALLDACRALGTRPLFVYASSLAVFGARPGYPMPVPVDDDTLPTPQGSYGIQKFIGEQLVADYTRKGFIRGRSVRPVTVSVRAGRPNGAASGFLSGMVREPLAGLRARVPVARETAVSLASPANTIAGFVRAGEASDAEWGAATAINLPGFTATVGEMADALERVAGPQATALLDWVPDPAIERLVSTWPGHVAFTRARGLGLQPDASFDDVIRDYIRENPDAQVRR
jgi:D-erythronate 2-dehydrogenase